MAIRDKNTWMAILFIFAGFALHINIASIIGMAIAIFLYRKAF